MSLWIKTKKLELYVLQYSNEVTMHENASREVDCYFWNCSLWISLSDNSYVTTAVESDSSPPQTCKSVTNEAGNSLHHTVCTYLDIYVCVWCASVRAHGTGPVACVLQYVLSVTVDAAASVSADGSDVCLPWVTQHIYHSLAGCVIVNAFLSLVLHTQTHTFYKFVVLSL